MKVRATIHVEGRVQGVFYRAHTKEQGRKLGLKGYVKNLRNGRVEVVVEGERQKIETLIEWLKIGPSLARVSDVTIEWMPYTGEFKKFSIKY